MPSTRRSFLRVVGGGLPLATGCLSDGTERPASSTTTSTTTSNGDDTTKTITSNTDLPRRLSWSYEIGNDIQHEITAKENTLYVPSSDLYALTDNGSEQWVFETVGEIHSTPLVNDALYVTHSNNVQAVEFDGAERWRISWDYGGKPYILTTTNERVYASGVVPIGAKQGYKLAAIDTDTGQTQWTGEVGTRSKAIVSENRIFVVGPGVVQAFSTRDGTKLWNARYKSNLAGLAGVTDGILVVYGDAVYGFSTDDGTLKWTVGDDADDDLGIVNAAIRDGHIFVATERDFRAVSTTTGQTRWKTGEFTQTPNIAVLSDNSALLTLSSTSSTDSLAQIGFADRAVQWTWSDGEPIQDVYRRNSGVLAKGETTLRSLDHSGRKRWQYDFGIPINSPTVTETGIYLGARTMDRHRDDVPTVPGTVYAIEE